MNRRAALSTMLACAVLGGWLPSLWLPAAEEKPRPLPSLSLPPSPASAGQDWQAAARQARSPMAAFQAIAGGISDSGTRHWLRPGAMDDPAFPEAEELARWLAADAFGRRATDPAAFLKSLEEMEDSDARDVAFRAWAEGNPDAALTVILHSGALHATGDVLPRLTAENPDKVVALLKTVHSGSHLQELWRIVLDVCTDRGPDYGLTAIQSAPEKFRSQALGVLLAKLAAKDPRHALTWLQSLPPDLHKLTNSESIFLTWSKDDPATALREWLATGAKVADYPGHPITSAWADKDPQALFEWALPLGKDAGMSLHLATRAMARNDPRAASEMLRHTPPDFYDPATLQSLLGGIGWAWCRDEPAAALAWARSLPAEQRDAVIPAMLSRAPASDRLALASELGTGTTAGFSALLSVDVEEAVNAFHSAPPATQLSVYRDLVSRLAETGDHARAAAFAATMQETDFQAYSEKHSLEVWSIREQLADQTARWTARDPAAAAAWAVHLPEGPAQNIAAANVAFTWGRCDLPAARAWVEQLPAGAARDKAAAQITRLTESSGP